MRENKMATKRPKVFNSIGISISTSTESTGTPAWMIADNGVLFKVVDPSVFLGLLRIPLCLSHVIHTSVPGPFDQRYTSMQTKIL